MSLHSLDISVKRINETWTECITNEIVFKAFSLGLLKFNHYKHGFNNPWYLYGQQTGSSIAFTATKFLLWKFMRMLRFSIFT